MYIHVFVCKDMVLHFLNRIDAIKKCISDSSEEVLIIKLSELEEACKCLRVVSNDIMKERKYSK